MARRTLLGEVVEHKTATIDPSSAGVERYVAIEHLEPMSLSIERWGDVSDGTTFSRCFASGDVLFSKRRAYQRKAARASFAGVCSGDLLVLSAKREMLHPALLPFIVQSKAFLEHALATSAGSLSPRTKWKDLATFELDLPDSARQERIAQLLTQTENARLAWKAVIDRTTELRRGVARDTRRTPQWPKVPLRQVATVQNGTTPSRTRSDYWAGGTVPWLPTGKVHEREIWTADEHITTKALEQCSLRVVPAGSVLVAMIGQGKTRGAAAFLQTDATINQNFAAVTPAPDLNGRFLFHMLDASYDALRHASQGSSQGALNCRLVGDFLVPLPPREQQDDLARHFDAIGMALTRVEEQMQRTHELQRQLTESVLMDKHVH